MRTACTGYMPPSADGHTAYLFEYAASRHVQTGTEAKEKQGLKPLPMKKRTQRYSGDFGTGN